MKRVITWLRRHLVDITSGSFFVAAAALGYSMVTAFIVAMIGVVIAVQIGQRWPLPEEGRREPHRRRRLRTRWKFPRSSKEPSAPTPGS